MGGRGRSLSGLRIIEKSEFSGSDKVERAEEGCW